MDEQMMFDQRTLCLEQKKGCRIEILENLEIDEGVAMVEDGEKVLMWLIARHLFVIGS
jgi:hypothetical protein